MNVFGLSPKMLIISTASPASASPVTVLSSYSPPRVLKRRRTTYSREECKEMFLKLQFSKAGDQRTVMAPRANYSPAEDYSEVFLSHARVYVFAEKFDIQPLKRLALRLLHETLSVFTLYPESVEDVLALTRFVYSETSKPSDDEPIRYVLKRYISYEMDVLLERVEFRDLLEENREILDDFLFNVARRIG